MSFLNKLEIIASNDIKKCKDDIKKYHDSLISSIKSLMSSIQEVEKSSQSSELKKACEDAYSDIKGNMLSPANTLGKSISQLNKITQPVESFKTKKVPGDKIAEDTKAAIEQISNIGEVSAPQGWGDPAVSDNIKLAKDILTKNNFMLYEKESGYETHREKWTHKHDKQKRILFKIAGIKQGGAFKKFRFKAIPY